MDEKMTPKSQLLTAQRVTDFAFVPNGSESFQMVPNGSHSFRLVPNGSVSFRLVPVGPVPCRLRAEGCVQQVFGLGLGNRIFPRDASVEEQSLE